MARRTSARTGRANSPWTLLAFALAALAAAFASISHFFPGRGYENYDSMAYVFIADGWIKGRTPYLQLWENKGLPLYALNALGRLITPHGYLGLYLFELAFMFVAFYCLIWTLRRFATVQAVVLSCVLLVMGVMVLSLGGNTPEFWNLALQATGLVAGWLLVSGEWRSKRWLFAVTGFAAGVSAMIKVTMVGTWIALLVLAVALTIARRLRFAEMLGVLGLAAAGFLAASLLSVAPIMVWGAVPAWWDQWIRFGTSMSAVGWPERFAAVQVDASRVYFLIGALLVGVIAAVVGAVSSRRRHVDATRVWMGAFLLGWLAIEVVASSANGLAYNHYTLPWLIPAVALVGLLFGAETVGWPAFAVVAVVIVAGVWLALPSYALRLELNAGFPPIARKDSPARNRADAAMIREVKKRTTPKDLILVWGMDPVVYNETGRLSAGPYGHPIDVLLAPGYQTRKQWDAFMRDLEQHPPKLIIDSSSLLRATPLSQRDTALKTVRPAITALAVSAPTDTAGGRIQPYMRSLPAFVSAHYRLVLRTKPDVRYYELIGD